MWTLSSEARCAAIGDARPQNAAWPQNAAKKAALPAVPRPRGGAAKRAALTQSVWGRSRHPTNEKAFSWHVCPQGRRRSARQAPNGFGYGHEPRKTPPSSWEGSRKRYTAAPLESRAFCPASARLPLASGEDRSPRYPPEPTKNGAARRSTVSIHRSYQMSPSSQRASREIFSQLVRLAGRQIMSASILVGRPLSEAAAPRRPKARA